MCGEGGAKTRRQATLRSNHSAVQLSRWRWHLSLEIETARQGPCEDKDQQPHKTLRAPTAANCTVTRCCKTSQTFTLSMHRPRASITLSLQTHLEGSSTRHSGRRSLLLPAVAAVAAAAALTVTSAGALAMPTKPGGGPNLKGVSPKFMTISAFLRVIVGYSTCKGSGRVGVRSWGKCVPLGCGDRRRGVEGGLLGTISGQLR
jgi:hypothetical protein